MGDNLKEKTINAIKWSAVDRIGQQGLQFIIGILLARNLSREDYGLIGSIAVFSAIAIVFVESGFSQALIRKQEEVDNEYSTVFNFNLLLSLFFYTFLYFLAPSIATFFRQPDLINICRVIFLSIPINALYLVPFTRLNKTLDFRTLAIINIASVIISGTFSLLAVFNNYGVWTLVIQQLSFHTSRLIISAFVVRWRPKAVLSIQVIKEFWGFSFHILSASFLNAVFNNIYFIIIGRFYKIQQVGDYTQANKMSDSFNYSLLVILTSTVYSVLSKVQHDVNRFRHIYREFVWKSSIIIFPILFFLIAIAPSLIVVLLSEKWEPSIPYFQMICFASLFNVPYSLTINALNALGKSKTTFHLELIKKGLILLSVIICFKLGIFVMLGGYAIASFTAYFISIFLLKKEINHYIRHQIKDFILPLIIGIIIAVTCYLISYFIENIYILLSTQIAIAAILYFFSLRIFFNDLFNQIISFIKKIIPYKQER